MSSSERKSKWADLFRSDEPNVVLAADVPCVFLTEEVLENLRVEIPLLEKGSHRLKAWETIYQRAEKAMKLDPAPFAYTGTNFEEYIKAAEATMNPMLFLSFCGAIMNKRKYIEKATSILLEWARANPLPGTQLARPEKGKRLTNTGLTLARFLDRIVETYRLVAESMMDSRDRGLVVRWIHEMGKSIQKSHMFWLNHHEVEGPQNHMSWHIFGMLLSGMVARDVPLIHYALDDPANRWNFQQIVDAAIYRPGRASCVFRSGCNRAGQRFSYDGRAESGEIFDRCRTLSARDEGKPRPCGMHYCLFNLRALVYTAHIWDCNVEYLRSLMDVNVQARMMRCCDDAILAALQFYGRYYVDYPTGGAEEGEGDGGGKEETKCITYAPYAEQRPDYENLPAFLLGRAHYPSDAVLEEVVATNVPVMHPPSQHPMQRPHPLTTPVCYLLLAAPPTMTA